MNRKTLGSIILGVMLVFSTLFVFPSVTSHSNETIVWFSADWHLDVNDTEMGDVYGGGAFLNAWDATNDSEGLGVDYAYIAGDMLSWYDPKWGNSTSYNGWGTDAYLNAWKSFDVIWSNFTGTIYKNWSIGNHDGGWWNQTFSSPSVPRASGAGGQYYFYDMGNIRLIFMADEETRDGGVHTGNGEVGVTQYNWVNASIGYAYTNNSNVFIVMHQRAETSWFSGLGDSGYQNSYSVDVLMDYWNGQGTPVSFFVCGHSHEDNQGANDWEETNYGTSCCLIGSLAYWRSGTPNRGYPCSRYMYLTNGSTTVTVRAYNHTSNTFKASNDFTFVLNWAWDDGTGESAAGVPEITSIDYQTNNGTILINDNTPYINWSLVNNTLYYNLVVANDSGFTDVYRNLTDVNNANYPTKYSENATRVTFEMPDAYTLANGTYYYRVRAKRWA